MKTKHSKTGIAVLILALFVTANITYQLAQHDTPIALIVPVALSILSNGLWLAERFDKAAVRARNTTAGA